MQHANSPIMCSLLLLAASMQASMEASKADKTADAHGAMAMRSPK